jgi:4-amino-4-deoxy-L-arabinose transferase-like glycosyltransferase
VLLLILAADAAVRAVHTGRLGSLLLAGIWIGLAFQVKMAEAWLIAPALALAYLVTARAGTWAAI